MPRFYFDVRHDGKVIADTEGEDLPDTAAAKREASIAALHLAKEILSGLRSTLIVEARDELGMPVARAKVSFDIENAE
jgi:hypothetical protein